MVCCVSLCCLFYSSEFMFSLYRSMVCPIKYIVLKTFFLFVSSHDLLFCLVWYQVCAFSLYRFFFVSFDGLSFWLYPSIVYTFAMLCFLVVDFVLNRSRMSDFALRRFMVSAIFLYRLIFFFKLWFDKKCLFYSPCRDIHLGRHSAFGLSSFSCRSERRNYTTVFNIVYSNTIM